MQFNDPDPVGWVLIYFAIAAITILSAFGKFNKWLTYSVIVIAVVWMVFLFPGLWQWLRYEPADALLYGMSDDKMYIEESREFLGLLMGISCVLYVMIWNRKIRK